LYPKSRGHFNTTRPRRLLREQVYHVLRARILQGELRIGARLVEDRLARDLGTSRMPVREALHRLEQEGLVRPQGRRGVVVARLDPGEVQEVMGLREILESHAAALAAVRVTPAGLRTLEHILARAEEALRSGELHALLQWNTRFHDEIVAASGSRRLRDLVHHLREALLTYRELTLRGPGVPARSHEEHAAILDALRRQDPEVAETLMRAHIRWKARVLLEALAAGLPA